MSELSTKPYLIRAIHQWCTDSGYTPYIAVLADDTVRVPREFVKNGEIVLNISPLATNRLQLGNDAIEFQARFGGVAREVFVPIEKVIAGVMAANPAQLADYRSGKDKLFGFFVGQVMKATGGKANPAQLNELLKQKLAG